jgi:hypothetical protein
MTIHSISEENKDKLQAGFVVFNKDKLIDGLVEVLAQETNPDAALKRVCAVISRSALVKDLIMVRVSFCKPDFF